MMPMSGAEGHKQCQRRWERQPIAEGHAVVATSTITIKTSQAGTGPASRFEEGEEEWR